MQEHLYPPCIVGGRCLRSLPWGTLDPSLGKLWGLQVPEA